EPKTVALVGADAEFSNNVLIGARENAKKYGLKIVYDRSYPPATVDYTPIMRAIQATSPDVVLVASYPPDSVGIVRSGLDQYMTGHKQVILHPPEYKDGELEAPFAK